MPRKASKAKPRIPATCEYRGCRKPWNAVLQIRVKDAPRGKRRIRHRYCEEHGNVAALGVYAALLIHGRAGQVKSWTTRVRRGGGSSNG
jgi:hypothetical protein